MRGTVVKWLDKGLTAAWSPTGAYAHLYDGGLAAMGASPGDPLEGVANQPRRLHGGGGAHRALHGCTNTGFANNPQATHSLLTGNSQPRAGNSQPRAGNPQPRAGNAQPRAGNSQPWAGNSQATHSLGQATHSLGQASDRLVTGKRRLTEVDGPPDEHEGEEDRAPRATRLEGVLRGSRGGLEGV
eukprot:1178963-Prorocentrum_minimum.AAC.2